MSNPVFFIAPEQLAARNPADVVELDGAEARHALSVKRLAVAEPLDLVDEQGGRASGVVDSVEDGVLRVRIESLSRDPEHAVRFVLIQALAKGDRDLQAIESATELGVHALIPWQAERSIVRWKGERALKSQGKWQSVVRAAAKQSRRALTPQVHAVLDSKALTGVIERAAAAFVLHESATTSLSALGSELVDDGVAGEVLLIVGPEGGISDSEIQAFSAAGARAVLLGPHVLRSSTAGPAALAVLKATLGHW